MFTAADERPAHRTDESRAGSSLVDPVFIATRVWRAKFAILGLGILGGGLAAAIALSMPKVYHASTQLIMDPRGLNLVQNEVTQTPLGLASDAALAIVQSQIAVITSSSVLSQVVDRAGLTQDPEFNGTADGPFDRYIPSIAFLSAPEPEVEVASRRQMTIENLRSKVSGIRSANSFVVNVTVESQDPQKAAVLANLVSEVFLEEQARVESETARRATDSVTARLAELRERVSVAEEAVETYKAQNQLVGVGGRLIDDEFILRINNQLAEVRGQITSLRVRAQSMRETSVDDVVDGAFPEDLASQALSRLRQTYSELSRENAVLASRLGPRHPQRAASDEAMTSSRLAIQGELSRIVASAQTELARAEETERALTAQLETLRGRQIETSGSFVQLRQLERDVEASRAVYEAYLLRSRELGEQESLNTANVRTISEATSPMQSSGPPRKLIVLAGLFLGLGLGFAIAVTSALWRLIREHLAAGEAARARPVSNGSYPVYTALPVPVTYSASPASERPAPWPPAPAAAPVIEDAPPIVPEPEPEPQRSAAGDPPHPQTQATAHGESTGPLFAAAAPETEGDSDRPAGSGAPESPVEQTPTVKSFEQPESNVNDDAGAREEPAEVSTPDENASIRNTPEPEEENGKRPVVSSDARDDDADAGPAPSQTPEEAPLDADTQRREQLRQRLREIAAKRKGGDAAAQAHRSLRRSSDEGGERLTVAEIRRRRAEGSAV